MTTRPISHAVIISSFFWAGTPFQVASFLSKWYAAKLSGRELIDHWAEEAAWNPLLRETRPPDGFGKLSPEEVSFLERMVRAGTRSEGMAA